jgi:hypothetical protein
MKHLSNEQIETIGPVALALAKKVIAHQNTLKDIKREFRAEYDDTSEHVCKILPFVIKTFGPMNAGEFKVFMEYLGFSLSAADMGLWEAISEHTVKLTRDNTIELFN